MVNVSGFNPENGEWNDSLIGEYIWSNTNIGETLSDVLTPFTWSSISSSFEQMNVLPGHPVVGNIGGRAYNNGSVLITAMRALGKNIEDLNTEMGGIRQEYANDLSSLMLPLPKTSVLSILSRGLRIRRFQKQGLRGIPAFLAGNRTWCDGIRQKISKTHEEQNLAALLLSEIEPYTLSTFWMVVGSAWEHGELVGKVRGALLKIVSPKDADVLLSNVSQETGLLASLGPLVGLAKVARGDMDRQSYLDLWGHRGPHESEMSIARPAEDPDWMDQQLAVLSESTLDVEELLARQKAEFEAVWQQFKKDHPQKSEGIRKQLAKTAHAARTREAVRSELVRMIWVARDWALRAGELTGLGETIFFLTSAEAVDLLYAKDVRLDSLPTREATHARYKALPPYPLLIRGQFDPFQWAADPARRTDFYDAYGTLDQLEAKRKRGNIIHGVPGSAGEVEGTVRRLDSPADWAQFKQDEILVTVQTNVGWSPIFPRAKAIITDVGAPLSHAAILARELGIPAVVNCGDATMRLKTGDRVRVDGSSGKVLIVSGVADG